jgi:hypothetical protein
MKMKVIYKPELRAHQEWVVDRGNPDWNISYPVETATDWGWIEFVRRLDGMSPSAWRALIWALRKIDEPRLRLDAVEIDFAEIDFEIMCPLCEVFDDPRTHECDFAAIDAADEDEADDASDAKAADSPEA